MGETSPAVRPRVGFVLERTLGHATHAQNLQAAIAPSTTIEPVFSTVDYESAAVSARFPLFATGRCEPACRRGEAFGG